MKPIYTDIHIHTSENPDQINESYDLELLISKIKEFSKCDDFLISFTDHNVINKEIYLKAVSLGIKIILGVELHIKNYDESPAYHCHIYFDLQEITDSILDDLNDRLNELYPSKVLQKSDGNIPYIQTIINKFDSYDFILLPHGGQSHATFDTSIPRSVIFDKTLERNIYYNHFEGFTARGNSGLESTKKYLKRIGISEFVNLITCSDNYNPAIYPKGKDKNEFVPTWMLAKPTFNGLRLSLSEQSRLIYSNEKPKLWSETIRSVRHSRDNIEIDVTLTFGLNVIIGGSSSGKTLLADSIYRCISKSEPNPFYTKYEVDKMDIDNPSGMIPHYLSQNYIVDVVNNISETNLENIDIIKKVFPGDEEIKEAINNGLSSFKKNIQDLIKHVRIIEDENDNLRKIPIISRLISLEEVDKNIFKVLLPIEVEKENLKFSKTSYLEFIESIENIDSFLTKYPFVQHNDKLIEDLKGELRSAFEVYQKEIKVRNIINQEKIKYDQILKSIDSEEQSKMQNFENLLISIKKYVSSYREFYRILEIIANYSINFGTEEIESMEHKLFIENDFVLNKDKFLEVINYYLRLPINSFDAIVPQMLFQTNFKKRPKVNDYDDFGNKIYSKFEELNKKKYRIITKDGLDFDNLSPGWKTSVILDIVLGYDKDISPIIIDQPEDNLATNYINKGLVTAIKEIKSKKQIILVSHNATIPMLADAQNIVLCKNENNKLIIESSPLEGFIKDKSVVDYIAEITDGGKSSIKKRVKKYNLKKFTEQ